MQSFNLIEISNWTDGKKVALPTVQRGFVWKPIQIENLWDSLLRGYPVGAFVLAKKEKSNNDEFSFDLLDGQQRATAICLGFGKETFRQSKAKYKVFIDLEKPKENDNRKYIFRVITKSHPWGYQRNDNSKTLDAENIRKAMDFYGLDDHLDADLNKCYPFDALLPIPLEFFLIAAMNENLSTLKDKIYAWEHWKKIKDEWNKKVDKDKKNIIEIRDEKKVAEKIECIFNDVKNMLDSENGRQIPALYFDFSSIITNSTSDDGEDGDQANDNEVDEIENLFIRLNAGGTPLSGEELNYSVLKANIDSNLQNKIEEACKELFNPARFITIIYRLFKNKDSKSHVDSAIGLRIKPKQFQTTIKIDIESFKDFINSILEKKNEFDGRTLLEYAKSILEYKKDINIFGLPYFIISNISDTAPEVMFMFLYRLQIMKDKFTFADDIHRRMLGMVSLFLWFGKGEKQKDHNKLLSNIWPCVKSLNQNQFWSSSTVQRAMLDDVLTALPSKEEVSELSANIKNLNITPKKDVRDKLWKKGQSLGTFATNSFSNKEFILYAQRQSLSDWFSQGKYHLDDTNIPFDWDHISPNKLIYSRRNIPSQIKYWYSTNGNFRAWPYSLNRMDQDSIPKIKLNPLNPVNYIDDVVGCKEIEKLWKKYFNKNDKIFAQQLDSEKLSKKLCDWSFKVDDWTDCEVIDIKKDIKGTQALTKLIVSRNMDILLEWYDNLMIGSLTPIISKPDFSQLINKKFWKLNPEEYSEILDYEDSDYQYWMLPISENNIYDVRIYFGHPNGDDSMDILRQDNIVFGIFWSKANRSTLKINIQESLGNSYYSDDTNNFHWIQGSFTLISFDEESCIKIFTEFKYWLEHFPNEEIKKLKNSFVKSLRTKHRDKV